MKKEALFALFFLVFFIIVLVFINGNITGLVSGEVPRFRVIVSLNTTHSSLLSGAAVTDFSDAEKIDLMKLEASLAQQEVIDDVNSKGLFSFMGTDDLIVERKYDVIPAMVVEVTEEGLLSLLNNPLVTDISSDYVFSIDLAQSIPLINASSNIFNMSGKGVGVCVVDTGIDNSHPAFSGRIVAEQCFCSNSCCPNGQNQDSNASDDCYNSHGTHVSGIVGSDGSVKGVAPGVNLISVKVCNAQGSCYTSDMISGIDYCIQNKDVYNISIVSGSIGDGGQHTPYSCPTFIDSALDAAAAADLFLVFASGNEGYSSGVSYPGCHRDVIAVGAVSKTDIMASFTNTGPGLDLLAPGVSIYSTTRNGNYGYLSGTSQATPHVSGMLAVLLEFAKMHNLTKSDVEDSLNKTDVFVEGFPRIDVGMALSYLFSLTNYSQGSNQSNFSNFPPVINVSSPLNLSQVISPVQFSASAFDPENGSLSVSWQLFDLNSSNSSVFLSYQGNVSLNLSEGNYSVVVSAFDFDNLSSDLTLFFEVISNSSNGSSQNLSNNTAPFIDILSPSNNSFIGKNLTLLANFSDVEDDANLSVGWFSSSQGFLGSGNNFSVLLNTGLHDIVAVATDLSNLSSNDSVSVQVGSCLVDFDQNADSQVNIGDVVLLFNGFMSDSLQDSSGVFCPQSGTCLFDFDQNNNSVFDIGDLVLVFSGFVEANFSSSSGDNCFSQN